MDTVKDEAKRLAEKHYEIEVGIRSIILLRQQTDNNDDGDKKIALLEINENTVPTGIMPLEFRPAPESGFHYPSIIVEVTPEEFERIKTKELLLPDGWSMGEEIPRPYASNGR